MPDREKVFRVLECCSNFNPPDDRDCPEECPYSIESNPHRFCRFHPLLDDVIALLREQNGVKPSSAEWLYDRPHHFRCSACGNNWGLASIKMRYCPDCGSKMFLSETERRKEWSEVVGGND